MYISFIGRKNLGDLEVIPYHCMDYAFFFFLIDLAVPCKTIFPLVSPNHNCISRFISAFGGACYIQGHSLLPYPVSQAHWSLCLHALLLSVLLQMLGNGCPSVFCPWRSGPSVFPVYILLRLLLVCFPKEKNATCRGKLAYCLYTRNFSVHIICIILYEITIF